MKARAPLDRLPGWLQRYILDFEAQIERAVVDFSRTLASGARVLDAGAGECQYAEHFRTVRYTAVDLGIGDQTWQYGRLDAVGDLLALPFADGTFDAALNIVTLEHVTDPARVVEELYRCLKPGGRLLLITPLEWEEHQQPHDYFRYTRFGLEHLTKRAGFADVRVQAVGGFFRLLSRRLMNSVQFFPGALAIFPVLFLGPLALTLPLIDGLDKRRDFTLGHICTARKPETAI
ncbi:MAG TPA: class I SAM-dependent methyltransferase [Bryobacteraceae bacterium]|nr:class I SAM-dependent methyltransferase [Bryobacteraceae bacterium]